MKGSLGFNSDLQVTHLRAPKPARARSIRLPGGRVIFTRDRGQSHMLSSDVMSTNLTLIHRGPDGCIKNVRDTGSGLVTNAGVNLMANDPNWTNCTLKQANFHAIGTGTTAAAATDVWLQTANGTTNLSGTTNGYMTGTQSFVSPNVYKTSATFTFTGAVAVTEWIVAIANGANITNTALNSDTATSATDTTHSPFAAANGNAMWTIESFAAGSVPLNTNPTTQPMFQISTSSTTVVSTYEAQWLHLDNTTASTPTAAQPYVVFPTAWDHKVFSVVNAANGDTIQTVYSLTINSGG